MIPNGKNIKHKKRNCFFMIQAMNLRTVEIQFKENESFWGVKINYTNAHFIMRTPVFQTTIYLYYRLNKGKLY